MKKVTLDDIRMKDIKGFEGLYAITSCGKVWSYKRKKFLTPFRNANGRLRVSLCNGKGRERDYFVHRLVAEAYIDNPLNLPEVDHKDWIYWHNYIGNLEWKTRQGNMCNNPRNLPCYDTTTGQHYCSISMAARETGVSQNTVKKNCNQYRDDKSRLPRFIYQEDVTREVVTTYFRQNLTGNKGA